MLINQIKSGEHGNGVYFCAEKADALTKNAKPYYSLTLRDSTGTLPAKIWETSIVGFPLTQGDYIEVSFEASTYNDQLQMVIHKIEKKVDVNPSDFFPTSSYDIEKMWGSVVSILGEVGNTWLRELVNLFITDEDFVAKFKTHSAAVKVHHAFVGGLMQHTLFVMRICRALTRIYRKLDADLLITCAFLHDLGKLVEMTGFPENSYTDYGTLVGHVSLGAVMIAEMCNKIPGFPDELKMKLIHCILAHHGEMEMGSPKPPELLESLALSHADNLDAKMEIFLEQLDAGGGYNRYLQTTCWIGGDS